MKGFYGTLDVSFDDTTKGENGMVAYPSRTAAPGRASTTRIRRMAAPDRSDAWAISRPVDQQVAGRLSRRHKIGTSDVSIIYQVETALAITASPGLKTSQYQQSNVVNGAIGLGDTFIGLQGP